MLNKTKKGLLAGLAVFCLTAPSAFALDLPQASELGFDFIDRSGLFTPAGTPRGVGEPASVGDEDRAIFQVVNIGNQVNPAPNLPPILSGTLPGLNLGTSVGSNMLSGTFYDLQLTQFEIFPGPDGVFGPNGLGINDDRTLLGFGRGVRQTNTAVNPGDGAGQGGATWTDTAGPTSTIPAGSGGIATLFLDTLTASEPAFAPGSAGPAGALPTLTANPGNLDGSLSHIQEYDNNGAAAGGKILTDGELWLSAVFTPLLQPDIDGYFALLGTNHGITAIDSVPAFGVATPHGSIRFALGGGNETIYLQQIDNASSTGDFFAYANVIGGSFADQMAYGLYGGPSGERDILFWGQNTVNPLINGPGPGGVNTTISALGYQGWQLDSTDPVAFGTRGPGIVPEPMTAGLSILALGALGFGATRRRRNA